MRSHKRVFIVTSEILTPEVRFGKSEEEFNGDGKRENIGYISRAANMN